MSQKDPHITCTEAMEALEEGWVSRSPGSTGEESWEVEAPPAPPGPAGLEQHLERCTECRSAAEDIRRLEHSLDHGFRKLAERIDDPGKERFDDLLARLGGESPDAKILRRMRRPLRMVLWSAFYAFTLLLSCLLLIALARVLAGS